MRLPGDGIGRTSRSRLYRAGKASVARRATTGDREGHVGVGEDPRRTSLHGQRGSREVGPRHVAPEALQDGSRISCVRVIGSQGVEARASEGEGHAGSADGEHGCHGGKSLSEEVGSRLRGGDDLLGRRGDAERCQVRGDLLGRPPGVVGDEGEPHAGRPRAHERVGSTRHRVLSHVDDAVEIEERDIVHRRQRRRSPRILTVHVRHDGGPPHASASGEPASSEPVSIGPVSGSPAARRALIVALTWVSARAYSARSGRMTLAIAR